MSLYLSRLRLSRAPSSRALDALLNPDDEARRIDAHHRLLWAVFSDGPDRDRDFLWRQEGPGVFLTLSSRPPAAHDLFEPPEVRDFAPVLAAGQRLAFRLRANATRTERTGAMSAGGKEKKRHVDLVMDTLKSIPSGERAAERMAAAQRAATAWLTGLGERSGFDLLGAAVEDYSTVALPGHRGPRSGQPQFGILDIAGEIELRDPDAFLPRLAQGFGRAKAFGCGLMLIRRGG